MSGYDHWKSTEPDVYREQPHEPDCRDEEQMDSVTVRVSFKFESTAYVDIPVVRTTHLDTASAESRAISYVQALQAIGQELDWFYSEPAKVPAYYHHYTAKRLGEPAEPPPSLEDPEPEQEPPFLPPQIDPTDMPF